MMGAEPGKGLGPCVSAPEACALLDGALVAQGRPPGGGFPRRGDTEGTVGGSKASPEIPTYLSIAVLTLRPTVPTGQAATEGARGTGQEAGLGLNAGEALSSRLEGRACPAASPRPRRDPRRRYTVLFEATGFRAIRRAAASESCGLVPCVPTLR